MHSMMHARYCVSEKGLAEIHKNPQIVCACNKRTFTLLRGRRNYDKPLAKNTIGQGHGPARLMLMTVDGQ